MPALALLVTRGLHGKFNHYRQRARRKLIANVKMSLLFFGDAVIRDTSLHYEHHGCGFYQRSRVSNFASLTYNAAER